MNSGAAVNTAISSEKCRAAEPPLGLGSDERHPAVGLEEARVDEVPQDLGAVAPSMGASPCHHSRQIRRPTVLSCRASASSCWATMCRGDGGGTTGSTQPCASSSSSPAALQQLTVVERRGTGSCGWCRARPVRPRRWRNDATVRGASIWMTRSRSPTSMPSSSVRGGDDDAVARLGEGLLGPASLVRGRARRGTRRSSTSRSPQRSAELLDASRGCRRTPAASRRGAGGRSPWRRCRASRRSRARPPASSAAARRGRRYDGTRDAPRAAAPCSQVEQLVGVADGGGQADALQRPAGELARAARARRAGASRGRRRRRRAPRRRRRRARRRSSAAWSTSTSTRASPRATPAWSAGCRAARRGSGRRARWPMSPCQSAARPAEPARRSRSSRGCRLLSSARSGQT